MSIHEKPSFLQIKYRFQVYTCYDSRPGKSMLLLLTYLLMKKIKKAFVLVLFFCLAIPVNRAQNIYINFKDGSHVQYALTDIRSILVSGDTMTLNKTDGTTLAWPESNIGNYNYKGILYGIFEIEILKDAIVYPNPGKGPFTIQYQLLKNSKVMVDIMDIHGKKVRQLKAENQSGGMNNLVWDGLDANRNLVSAGIYLCKISTGNNFISKRILVN